MITFLLITLAIAVVIALVWQAPKGKPSDAATGLKRLGIAWLAVVIVSGLLLVAWGIVALHSLEGFNR